MLRRREDSLLDHRPARPPERARSSGACRGPLLTHFPDLIATSREGAYVQKVTWRHNQVIICDCGSLVYGR
jgi:hypothetical protein